MTIRIPLTRARAAAAAAGAGAAVALAAALPATPASAYSGGFRIPTSSTVVNAHSGKCLEIADWRTDNGAPARQWDCTGGANQRWDYVSDSGGFRLVNRFSGKCLEIADWSRDYGAPARQWDCTGGWNQHWNYSGSIGSHNELGLSNLNSAFLLEIADWRTDNGAPARQWPGSTVGVCQGNQAWITAITRL
ncbi:RICIN domain-containing protein [Kitasatospora sp. NPDC018058]|uniref:RICIN domain-containing protein n=1 Tax=Kitasatospora sp. NPDC018058 TaxID=3364025 RepID=UPI0037C17172